MISSSNVTGILDRLGQLKWTIIQQKWVSIKTKELTDNISSIVIKGKHVTIPSSTPTARNLP